MNPDPKKPIRVRFAPSPTGPFHIGNSRAALFTWIFARHEGGKFLLRIEDTDKKRSKKEHEKAIIDGLTWLGIDWDEELVRQSERLPIYERYLKQLIDENKAYHCFCSEEELETERQAQLSQGLAPKYSGRCLNLTPEQIEENLKSGKSFVIRFKMPDKKVAVNDLIRGRVEIDANLLGDIIIAKGLREPLYNFAAAIDDVLMEITHVIRGEDHLSNTPKQIVIQEALGFQSPVFAHLPLILGPDRKKLSKRYLDASLEDYRQAGFLAEAMVNFLVLLGWHPIKDREIISREEVIKEFDLGRVQKGGAIFNQEKLYWLNAHYIKEKPSEKLIDFLKPFIPESWPTKKKMFLKILEVEKERMKTLKDFKTLAGFFFELIDYPETMLLWKETSKETTADNLKECFKIIEKIGVENFKEKAEKKIMALAEKRGRGEVLWSLRVALSGQTASPGPIEILGVLSKQEIISRIKIAIKKLEK